MKYSQVTRQACNYENTLYWKVWKVTCHYFLFSLGVLKEAFVEKFLKADFYKNMTEDMKDDWQKRTGKSVVDSMKEFLIDNVGTPINKLIR